jgi:hypothetical protein
MMDVVVVWCGAVGRQAISITLYQRTIFPQQTMNVEYALPMTTYTIVQSIKQQIDSRHQRCGATIFPNDEKCDHCRRDALILLYQAGTSAEYQSW